MRQSSATTHRRHFRNCRRAARSRIRSILERFRSAHGDKRLHLLEQRHYRQAAWRTAAARAHNWLSALRGLLAFAMTEGFIKENPAVGIKFAAKDEGASLLDRRGSRVVTKRRIQLAPRRAWLWPCRYTLPCENQIFFGWGRSTFATVFCMSRTEDRRSTAATDQARATGDHCRYAVRSSDVLGERDRRSLQPQRLRRAVSSMV